MANLTAGAVQTATVPIKVTPSGLSCGVRVLLSLDSAMASIVSQSSVVSFTSTGSQQQVAVQLTVPTAGTHYAFVAVYINGILVGVWSNPSVNVVAPVLSLSNWFPIYYLPWAGSIWWALRCTARIDNNTDTEIVGRILKVAIQLPDTYFGMVILPYVAPLGYYTIPTPYPGQPNAGALYRIGAITYTELPKFSLPAHTGIGLDYTPIAPIEFTPPGNLNRTWIEDTVTGVKSNVFVGNGPDNE